MEPGVDSGCLLGPPRPLQLVMIDTLHDRVEVNEGALREFEESLRVSGADELAVVSVTGAFRTGKSLLLDLFLRFLRYEEQYGQHSANPAFRIGGPVVAPPWAAGRGPLEGASNVHADGFRFAGGMEACTKGIWVWSKPFLRKVSKKELAVVLMDTQGAFDASQTRAQSGMIFGLARLLSSRHIHNVQQQIAEDDVHNLTYFLSFAQGVFQNMNVKSPSGGCNSSVLDLAEGAEPSDPKPFQSLDLIIRDWRWMESGWDLGQCRRQMQKHLVDHTGAKNVQDAAELLKNMVSLTDCWCFPHPGDYVTDPEWSGDIGDIDPTFLYFVDAYAKEIFGGGPRGLSSRTTFDLGLNARSFGPVLKNYISAFSRCVPTNWPTSLLQAVSSSAALQAKERAERHYRQKMSCEIVTSKYGLDGWDFRQAHRRITEEVRLEFNRDVFSCSTETWPSIEDSLAQLKDEYLAANSHQHERALVWLWPYALISSSLFISTKVLELTLTWWSQRARHVSNVLGTALLLVVLFISVFAYFLYVERGWGALLIGLMNLAEELVKQVFSPWTSLAGCEKSGRKLFRTRTDPLLRMSRTVSVAASSSAL